MPDPGPAVAEPLLQDSIPRSGHCSRKSHARGFLLFGLLCAVFTIFGQSVRGRSWQHRTVQGHTLQLSTALRQHPQLAGAPQLRQAARAWPLQRPAATAPASNARFESPGHLAFNYREPYRPRGAAALTLATRTVSATATPLRVAVSGAGGQTGQLAFRKMLAQPELFDPIGIVRTEESRAALLEIGVPAERIVVADVTDPDKVIAAMQGCAALIIGTSAKPAPSGAIDEASGRPLFGFPNGQPEQVDWLGQKAQIDAAKACGSGTHVVICSSMGGTDPTNMLNTLGREKLPDGSEKGGNILLWKRKAEKYLIDSGLPYTVVHPGGLINEPGGRREIVIGVDDDRTEGERSIPREDVAEVLVQALLIPEYRGRSFDIRSKVEGEGEVTTDFSALLDKIGSRNCDYSLGTIA